MNTVFISGHRDITDEEMRRLYHPAIIKAVDNNCNFVVGDYWGVDEKAQEFLSILIPLLRYAISPASSQLKSEVVLPATFAIKLKLALQPPILSLVMSMY